MRLEGKHEKGNYQEEGMKSHKRQKVFIAFMKLKSIPFE